MRSGPCPLPSQYDYATAAGHYAELTGVLAGVAFTALVLFATLMSGKEEQPKHTQATARALLVAFLGLTMSTVSYATLAGDVLNPTSIADDEIYSAIGFSVSAMVLLYGVALLFESSRLHGLSVAARSLHRFSGTALPLFLLANVYGASVDYNNIVGDAWVYYAVGVVAVTLAAWSVYQWRRARSLRDTKVARPNKTTPTVVLLISVLAAMMTVSNSGSSSLCGVDGRIVVLGFLVAFAVASMMGISASLERRLHAL